MLRRRDAPTGSRAYRLQQSQQGRLLPPVADKFDQGLVVRMGRQR